MRHNDCRLGGVVSGKGGDVGSADSPHLPLLCLEQAREAFYLKIVYRDLDIFYLYEYVMSTSILFLFAKRYRLTLYPLYQFPSLLRALVFHCFLHNN